MHDFEDYNKHSLIKWAAEFNVITLGKIHTNLGTLLSLQSLRLAKILHKQLILQEYGSRNAIVL